MKPIRIALVGVGQWGQLWIENLKADPNFEIVALIDTDNERVKLACSKFNLSENISFTDLRKCIRETAPDAALIVVPPKLHFPTVMTCIENKIHLISEKPLANSMEEAIKIKQASEEQEILFMVSQDYRWQPPIQAMHNAITKGLIGKPGYAIYRHFQDLRIGGWREQMDHVILEDMAIHHFDILRYITGLNCQEIYATSINPSWSWYTGGATANVILKFQDDFFVNYFATWVTTGEVDSWPGEIRIEGEYGSLSLTARGDVKLKTQGKQKKIKPPEMAKTGRAYALSQFLNGVNNKIKPDTEIGDNIKSFAMVQAAIKSVQENQPVQIDGLLHQKAVN